METEMSIWGVAGTSLALKKSVSKQEMMLQNYN